MKINLIYLSILLSLLFQNSYSQKSQEETIVYYEKALDSLKKEPVSSIRDSSIAVHLAMILELNYFSNKYKKNWKERIQPLKVFTKISTFPKKEAYLYFASGHNFSMEGLNQLSIEDLNKSIALYNNFGDQKMIGRVYQILSNMVLLTILNNPDSDSETRNNFFEFSTKQLLKSGVKSDTFLLATYNLNVGFHHFFKKEYQKAQEYFIKSYGWVDENSEKYFFEYFNGKWLQGLCLLYRGQNKRGFELINEVKKNISVSNSLDAVNLRANMGYLLGAYFIEKANYTQAMIETNYGEKNNPLLQHRMYRHFYNKSYYKIHKAKGDYKKALDFHEKIATYDRELEKNEMRGYYIKWANREENIAKDNKINDLQLQNLNQNNERQKLLRNLLVFGVFALGALAIYILKSNKQLKDANTTLIQKNKEIETALFKGQHLERKRVASELHDTLATKVSALKWRMEALIETLETDKEPFEIVVKSLEELYTDIRFISHNLLPEELEREGLKNTLSNLIVKLNRLNKTNFRLVLDGLESPLERMVQYEFYNVILELCNNILKHSQAKSAFISISEIGQKIYLTVTDDGVGIYHKKNAKGIGLSNIKNRIDSIGGEMNIESNGEGTQVTVII